MALNSINFRAAIENIKFLLLSIVYSEKKYYLFLLNTRKNITRSRIILYVYKRAYNIIMCAMQTRADSQLKNQN